MNKEVLSTKNIGYILNNTPNHIWQIPFYFDGYDEDNDTDDDDPSDNENEVFEEEEESSSDNEKVHLSHLKEYVENKFKKHIDEVRLNHAFGYCLEKE